MKKTTVAIVMTGAALILFGGCTDESPLISEEELIVVWAFLYAGEPVTDIKLTATLPLNVDTGEASPINNALVTLIKDGQRYECELTPGDSGYYQYGGTGLIIETGDEFTIEIEHGDQFVTATTSVPEKPISVAISSSIMEVPDFSEFGRGRSAFQQWRESGNNDIIVTWNNEDELWYYVTLLNIDEDPNPEPVNIFGREILRSFIFPPLNDDTYRIRLPLITHLGLHRITVYKVNQEYVDLYESREQDSRDLNEPLTNIEGGLGVFAAFNSESVVLEVIKME